MKHLLFILLITLLLASCNTYEPVVRTNFTPSMEVDCPERPNNVYLFYEGQRPPPHFTEIGMIEAFAHDSVSPKKVKHYLQYRAWQVCADGIMHVRTTYEIRGKDTVTVLTGAAIRLDNQNPPADIATGEEVEYDLELKEPADTTFRQTVLQDSQHREKTALAEDKKNITIVAGILALIFVAIALL